jgi:transmembrane sensor
MKNIRNFPNRLVIEEEAYDWLIKLDRDEAPSKQDLEALREWLGRSPVHRQELNKLNTFWDNNILTELVVPLGRHDSNAGFFARLGQKFWHPAGLAATAATAILAVALSLWFGFALDPLTETNGLYLTAVGQQKNLSLDDGSSIQLNTNSQIKVEYNKQYRNIRLLQGEAHFVVAKNTGRPFRVYAGVSRVEAVGTAFTVYLNNKVVNVLVDEGRVALATLGTSRSTVATVSLAMTSIQKTEKVEIDSYVNSRSQNLGILKAGQSITLDIAESTEAIQQELIESVEEIEADELGRRQAWRNGLLIFTGEPLEQVVQEVSRYTTVSIEIVDPALREIQIGGRFRVGEIEDMIIALETNFDLQVNWLNYNRVQLSATQ